MERRSITGFIALGTAVRFIEDAAAGNPFFGEGWYDENLAMLLEACEENRLHVTRRLASYRLEHVAEVIRERAFDWINEEQGRELEDFTLNEDEASHLRHAAIQVRETLLAEAVGLEAFFTSDKRYEVQRLLGDVPGLMSGDTFNQLPDIAQMDFAAACRSVAFELPTAAAFHLMRGAEAVLRSYYCRLVKQKRVSPLMWGPMTTHLRKRGHLRPPEVLLDALDHLRNGFRNPTQHPDKIYDIDEAQDLMGLCFDVVARIYRHLDEVDR